MSRSAFCCPVCGGALTLLGGALRCCNGHSFDTAKEGYVNLLLASRMKSKAPGDNKEMVAARHAFLQSGGYALFADALAGLCARYALSGKSETHILDAGCGEGYYDAAVCAQFAREGRALWLAGLDIAKPAVRLAAKRSLPGAEFAVASSFAMPVQAGWADLVLNVFSPFARAEFLRCLAPDGRLIYAVPTARHLMGLKTVLYDRPYENPVQQIEYEGFVQADELTVETPLCVEGALVEALFAMTPYYWKTPADGAARLAAVKKLETPVGFRFLVYEKRK